MTEAISNRIAAQNEANPNLAAILSTSPQTLTTPVSYRLTNLIPFDQPVYVYSPTYLEGTFADFLCSASAVTFVGLLYQLVLSFFIVVCTLDCSTSISSLQDSTQIIGYTARQLSGFERLLSTRSLIALRMVTSFTAYFFLSVSRPCYAHGFPVTHKSNNSSSTRSSA